MEVLLTQGKIALIDDEDWEKVEKYKWAATWDGFNWYATAYVKGSGRLNQKTIRMHRLVLNPLPIQIIDHVNGNGLDNRKTNLRLCTQSQNLMNKKGKTNSRSKMKGIYWNKVKNKWIAQIKINNKRVHLGTFDDKESAALAYDMAASKFFGKYARLNFPEGGGSYSILS